jgi:hypothetical protein
MAALGLIGSGNIGSTLARLAVDAGRSRPCRRGPRGAGVGPALSHERPPTSELCAFRARDQNFVGVMARFGPDVCGRTRTP